MTTITNATVEEAVLARLEEADGWVYAADLVDLIPAGRFWVTMDRLRWSGKVIKRGYTTTADREPGRLIDNGQRPAFRLFGRGS